MRLFAPIVNLFENLNESQRFSLIGIILGIPIIVLTLFFIILLNNDIKAIERSYHGIHYNYLIKDLLKQTDRYRYETMINFAKERNSSEDLDRLAEAVDQQISLITDFETKLTNSAHKSAFVKQLEKRWEYVIQSNSLTELSRAYGHFLTCIIEQLEIIAVDYHLNLAKDKYIYNLTNTVIKLMPRLIEQLNQIQMAAQQSFPNIQDEEDREIIYSTSSIRNLMRELELGRKVMLTTDTSYQKYISYQDPPIFEEISNFIYYIEYEYDANNDPIESIIDRADEAIQASFELYNRELSHFDAILDEKLERNKLYRFLIIMFQLIAFILTVYSFIGFYVAIKQSFKQMDKEREIAKDKYREVQQKLIHVEKKLSRQIMRAHEEERQRIARDLHDGIGQALYSILINLKVVESQVNTAVKENIQDIANIVETVMDDVRRISHTLRPEVLNDLGFIPALKSFINHFQKIYAIKVHFSYTDENTRLHSEIETHLYRICQEALTNIAKHSKATKTHVSLEVTETDIVLIVKDNGRGFAVDEHLKQQSRDQIGLYSMKERAKLLNGSFNIKSTINEGTKIRVEIPKVD